MYKRAGPDSWDPAGSALNPKGAKLGAVNRPYSVRIGGKAAELVLGVAKQVTLSLAHIPGMPPTYHMVVGLTSSAWSEYVFIAEMPKAKA